MTTSFWIVALLVAAALAFVLGAVLQAQWATHCQRVYDLDLTGASKGSRP